MCCHFGSSSLLSTCSLLGGAGVSAVSSSRFSPACRPQVVQGLSESLIDDRLLRLVGKPREGGFDPPCPPPLEVQGLGVGKLSGE